MTQGAAPDGSPAPRIWGRWCGIRHLRSCSALAVVEKRTEVDLSDLNLARTADLYAVETRVGEAATMLCNEFDRQFPNGSPTAAVCIRRAVDDAMAQVQQTIRWQVQAQ